VNVHLEPQQQYPPSGDERGAVDRDDRRARTASVLLEVAAPPSPITSASSKAKSSSRSSSMVNWPV
jgi:hypothetical protein